MKREERKRLEGSRGQEDWDMTQYRFDMSIIAQCAC